MKELQDRKIDNRLKSDLKRQKNFNRLVLNSNLKKKEDCKNKQKLKKLNFNLQFASKEN